MATDAEPNAREHLRKWWIEHSTTTALLAAAQLLWPTFLEWKQCVFWVPPFADTEDWKSYLLKYGPEDWVSLPLARRRELAAQLGEQALNHLARLHLPAAKSYPGDDVTELFGLISKTWPKALAEQFPGRLFSLTEVDRGDGLTIRLAEL